MNKELQEYSFEVNQALAHRREKRRHRMIIRTGAVLFAALIFNAVFRPFAESQTIFHGNKIVVVDEVTKSPAGVLLDATKETIGKAATGQAYIVKVTVEAM